jgi:hypothetical protein
VPERSLFSHYGTGFWRERERERGRTVRTGERERDSPQAGDRANGEDSPNSSSCDKARAGARCARS